LLCCVGGLQLGESYYPGILDDTSIFIPQFQLKGQYHWQFASSFTYIISHLNLRVSSGKVQIHFLASTIYFTFMFWSGKNGILKNAFL